MNRNHKKIILILLVTCMIAGMVGMTQPALAAGTFRTTDTVNLRAEPSTSSNSVTVVNSGTSVEVLDHNPAGWSHVQVGNSIGYIRSDFLKFPIGDTPATFSTTDGVNIRSAASTDSSIVGTVIAKANVEVTDHNPAGWSSVRVNGTTGFIRSDYLTRGGSGESAATTSISSASSSNQAISTLKTTGTVNLRSGPSTDTDILRPLPANTSIDILENQSNGWSKVKHNNTEGFIRSDLLSVTGSATPTILRTAGNVNFRTGPSKNNDIIRKLPSGTGVEVIEQQSNGWSKVLHNSTEGFIRSDLLTSASGAPAIAVLRTTTGVNFRTGPSTNDSIIRLLTVNTAVDVLENQSNGWSRVRHKGTEGFIRSDLLGTGARIIELLDWSTAKNIVQTGVSIKTIDVRTGISFNIRGFSKSGHMDVEPVTKDDTEAMLRSRNGVWAWAPRPVWVTIGDRTFAAALNGMPHDVSTIRDNGVNGHFCLHFNNTVTKSKSYQRNLNNAVVESYDARPR